MNIMIFMGYLKAQKCIYFFIYEGQTLSTIASCGFHYKEQHIDYLVFLYLLITQNCKLRQCLFLILVEKSFVQLELNIVYLWHA